MMNESKSPTVVCMAPVKNEGAHLGRFLRCALLWADHVVLLDQSTDAICREIADEFYQRVHYLADNHQAFDEPRFRSRLIAEARKFAEPRLLVALDADEVLSANVLESPEWQTVLAAQRGTLVRFSLVNLAPDGQSCWQERYDYPFALMDDGSAFDGRFIHGARMAIPESGPSITLRDIKVLHYAYVDEARHHSKLRWYQCLESLGPEAVTAVRLCRKYAPERLDRRGDRMPVQEQWTQGYEQTGVDMTSVFRPVDYASHQNHMDRSSAFWWDEQVLAWLVEYGTARFRRLDIWHVDWNRIAARLGVSGNFPDPRRRIDRVIHRWLAKTRSRAGRWYMRIADRLLARVYG